MFVSKIFGYKKKKKVKDSVQILSFGFNEDQTILAIGTTYGYRLYEITCCGYFGKISFKEKE